MRLKTKIKAGSAEMLQILSVGQWTTVYVVYTFTYGGHGFSKIYINGADALGIVAIIDAPRPSVFSNLDVVKIGRGFIGQLRRIQIYSPAASSFVTGSGIF